MQMRGIARTAYESMALRGAACRSGAPGGAAYGSGAPGGAAYGSEKPSGALRRQPERGSGAAYGRTGQNGHHAESGHRSGRPRKGSAASPIRTQINTRAD